MKLLYLDGHATTPLSAEAKAAMLACWDEPMNAGSPHGAGTRAASAAAEARKSVATLIGANPAEIVFTSGATESNNLALVGVARAMRAPNTQRRRLVTVAIEHKSILACAEHLAGEGMDVVMAPVGRDGIVLLDALRDLVDETTLLVSIGAANGEIGIVQPMAEVARIAHAAGALVHSDIAQLAGKLPIDVRALGLDYASLSSHKMYGPVGVGALFVSETAPKPAPLFFGGPQEDGIRPGTLPVPLVAGFGAAAMLAAGTIELSGAHGRRLASRFLEELNRLGIPYRVNGHDSSRLPGSLNIQLPGFDAQRILERLLDRVAMSTVSACQSQARTSHVLQGIGLSLTEQKSSVRLFGGRFNDEQEMVLAAGLIAETIGRMEAEAEAAARGLRALSHA